MMDYPIIPIAGLDDDRQAALLELNNANARETSFLTAVRWREMVARAFAANSAGNTAGLLIAFDQTADYDSDNFIWFRNRLAGFVYVDRIVVSADHRGAGLARRLYEDLFRKAADAGHGCIVCEVNRIPPNPGSDAFHAGMGFEEIGRATLAGAGKTVRYLRKNLG